MTEAASSSALYRCTVMHARRFPVRYRFRYRLFSLLLDLDELPRLDRELRLFAYNRPAPLAFYDRDHGLGDGSPLRPWIEGVLAGAGIDLEDGRVRLLTLPRLWGFVFNPLSLWFCHHADGSLRAVLGEVHNTFGERHGYLLHQGGRPVEGVLRTQAAKRFHVSPFIGMEARYRFTIAPPARRLRIVIHEYQQEELMLTATQSGLRETLTDGNLIRVLARFPLATLKVVTAIHWEALKLWLRGVPVHRKPSPPDQTIT